MKRLTYFIGKNFTCSFQISSKTHPISLNINISYLANKMIKNRAKAREVTTNDYMKGNLLLKEVKAKDVAKAFFHLAISKKPLVLFLLLMVEILQLH